MHRLHNCRPTYLMTAVSDPKISIPEALWSSADLHRGETLELPSRSSQHSDWTEVSLVLCGGPHSPQLLCFLLVILLPRCPPNTALKSCLSVPMHSWDVSQGGNPCARRALFRRRFSAAGHGFNADESVYVSSTVFKQKHT